MSVLVESAIKVAVLTGLALVTVSLLRHHSAALRHWVLAAAIAAGLATPVLMLVAPSWTLPVHKVVEAPKTRRVASSPAPPLQVPPRSVSIDIRADTRAESSIDVTAFLLPLWLSGVALNLCGLLVGLIRLARVSSRASVVRDGPWVIATRSIAAEYRLTRSVRLLQSDQPDLLVTWGFLTPKVMLPADADAWAVDRIRVVLAHELAHVQRCDWTVQIAGELLRIVYWFNPLVWLACRQLRREGERACDDAVVNLGIRGDDYATHLLDLARKFGTVRQGSYPAVAIAPRPSGLEQRVSAMLNMHLDRHPVSTRLRLVTAAAALALALPVALFAQNRYSTVSGTIVDESGAFLPGVLVVAADMSRGIRHEVFTSRTGYFEVDGLPQGLYTLEAGLPGFENFERLVALDGQDVNRDITLRLGSLQEVIAVTRGGLAGLPGERFPPRPPNCEASADAANNRERIGGQIRIPRKLHHVPPIYPDSAGEGSVTLDAVIGTDGFVQDVALTNGAEPVLAQAAIDAVRQWEFDPTLLNCTPVEVRMSVQVDFR